jgi:type IV pilus biogenesis protein CpaD/CtpE
MKMRANGCWVVVVLLSLGGCKNKEKVQAPEAPAVVETPTQAKAPVQAPPTAPTPVVKAVALSPQERAAKLGFVQYLPQDTEVVMAFHQGSKSVDRMQSGKLWKFVAAQMGLGVGPAGKSAMDDGDAPVQQGEQDGDARNFEVPATPDAA